MSHNLFIEEQMTSNVLSQRTYGLVSQDSLSHLLNPFHILHCSLHQETSSLVGITWQDKKKETISD